MSKSFHEAHNRGHRKLPTGRGGKVVHAMRTPGEFEKKMIIALREARIKPNAVKNSDD